MLDNVARKLLLLRTCLERHAERRRALLTVTCGPWSVTVRAAVDRRGTMLRIVDAWNSDPFRRAGFPARVDSDDALTITTPAERAPGGRLKMVEINVSTRHASVLDLVASAAATAALFVLPGGRPSRAQVR